MAKKSAVLAIRIVSDADNAKKGFDNTGRDAERFAKRTQAAAMVAGAAIAGFAVHTAREFEAVTRSLQTATGAVDDDLDGLVDSVKNISTAVPAAVGEIADVVGIIQTATGATGDQLEHLTAQVMDAARLLGEDGATSAANYGQAINQWGIDADDAAASMDHLYTLTQDYGVGLDQLTGNLSDYGSVLQNAGFSMDETADLFARLDQSGISVSRVMPGLNRAFRDWAQEQRDPQEALGETIAAMQEATTQQEALAIATDVFGSEGAQRMTVAVRDGTFALEDLGAGMADAQGAVAAAAEENRTLEESFQLLKNGAMVAIEPVASQVFGFLADTLADVSTFVADNSEAFAVLAGVIAGIATTVVAVNGALAAFRTAQTLATGVVWLAQTAWVAKAAAVVAATWPYLAIVGVIAGVVAIVKHLWEENETFRAVVLSVVDAVVAAWDWLYDMVATAIGWVIDKASEFIDWIKNIGSTTDGVSDKVVTALKIMGGPIVWVTELVIKLIGWLKNISWPSPPGWVSDLFGGAAMPELSGVAPDESVFRWLPDAELTASLAEPPSARMTAALAGTGGLSAPGTTNAAPAPTVVNNVTVNGALDPLAVADQIRDVIERSDRVRGNGLARSFAR